MKEPKEVTAITVVIYMAIAGTGAMFISGADLFPWGVTLSGVLMFVAGVLGAPSAWFGSWWLEGPSALLATTGIMLIAVDEVVLPAPRFHWPAHVIILSVIIALFFLARALRVWPYSYRPGVLPKSKLEQAEESYRKAREEYLASLQDD